MTTTRTLTLAQAVAMFSTERKAERQFERSPWPTSIACPRCGSLSVTRRRSRKPMPLRCRDCRGYFSVRTGTVMAGESGHRGVHSGNAPRLECGSLP